jgi:hypothetical protein
MRLYKCRTPTLTGPRSGLLDGTVLGPYTCCAVTLYPDQKQLPVVDHEPITAAECPAPSTPFRQRPPHGALCDVSPEGTSNDPGQACLGTARLDPSSW